MQLSADDISATHSPKNRRFPGRVGRTMVLTSTETEHHITPIRLPPGMMFYEQIRQEHWLRDKADEGKSLILDDDSSWEVHPSDQFITAKWLRGSTIVVEYTEKQGYPYLLRNRTEGEVARANLLGVFRVAG